MLQIAKMYEKCLKLATNAAQMLYEKICNFIFIFTSNTKFIVRVNDGCACFTIVVLAVVVAGACFSKWAICCVRIVHCESV